MLNMLKTALGRQGLDEDQGIIFFAFFKPPCISKKYFFKNRTRV